jgi:hypothetical protein
MPDPGTLPDLHFGFQQGRNQRMDTCLAGGSGVNGVKVVN